MEDSILNSVKKVCGLDASYTPFDDDILMNINGAFSTLQQLGIGPVDGFEISDAVPTWSDYVQDDPRYNTIKNYVCLKTRIVFDPPTTSFHLSAMQEQIKELEWRLSVRRENDTWVDPTPVLVTPDPFCD